MFRKGGVGPSLWCLGSRKRVELSGILAPVRLVVLLTVAPNVHVVLGVADRVLVAPAGRSQMVRVLWRLVTKVANVVEHGRPLLVHWVVLQIDKLVKVGAPTNGRLVDICRRCARSGNVGGLHCHCRGLRQFRGHIKVTRLVRLNLLALHRVRILLRTGPAHVPSAVVVPVCGGAELRFFASASSSLRRQNRRGQRRSVPFHRPRVICADLADSQRPASLLAQRARFAVLLRTHFHVSPRPLLTQPEPQGVDIWTILGRHFALNAPRNILGSPLDSLRVLAPPLAPLLLGATNQPASREMIHLFFFVLN